MCLPGLMHTLAIDARVTLKKHEQITNETQRLLGNTIKLAGTWLLALFRLRGKLLRVCRPVDGGASVRRRRIVH